MQGAFVDAETTTSYLDALTTGYGERVWQTSFELPPLPTLQLDPGNPFFTPSEDQTGGAWKSSWVIVAAMLFGLARIF